MNYRDELRRKTFHMCSAVFPLAYWLWLSREQMLWVAVPLAAAQIAVDLLRQRGGGFERLFNRVAGPLMRQTEHRTLTGASYVMIAVCAAIWLFPKNVAVTCLLFLSISDALASLVGAKLGGPRLMGKSAAGSGAFLLSAILIAALTLGGGPVRIVLAALVGTVVEALPLRIGALRIDDNLTVPMLSGAAILLV